MKLFHPKTRHGLAWLGSALPLAAGSAWPAPARPPAKRAPHGETAPVAASLPHASARWAQRESAAAEAEVANEFLHMLVLDGSISTPALQAAAKEMKQEKPAAYRGYLAQFLERLRNADTNDLALILRKPDEEQGEEEEGKPGAKPAARGVPKAADELMAGVARFDGQAIVIGEPGAVDWRAPWDKNVKRPPSVSLHTSAVFLPLMTAFQQSGDRKYLDRWVAYLDDWSLNDDYFDRLNPILVPDTLNAQSVGFTMATVKALSRLSRADSAAIPPRVLAQVLRRFLLEVVPCRVTYLRSNTHNWTPSTELMALAKVFEEFKVAQFYFREGRRRNVEDNAVTQNLRDGTENQQDHWYNPQYLKVAAALDLIENGSALPGWNALRTDAAWKEELKRHLRERTTWLLHDRTPQNSLPIPWNGGFNRMPEIGGRRTSPEAFDDPVNSALLRFVKRDKTADPGYTAEWFPYGGFNIVRDGWKRNSGYGAMFTSPRPGAYGGGRSRSNNNTFGLNAYGHDLLIDDCTGHYMNPSSPIRVDGRNQFFHAGIFKVPQPSGHKAYQVNAWQEPAGWRWHASENFNLMEGVYSGAWASPREASVVLAANRNGAGLAMDQAKGFAPSDITHQRLALYLRAQKLWILDDRLLATGAHQYAQQWIFPLRPDPSAPPEDIRTGPAFEAAKITWDQAAKKISTNEPTAPAFVGGKLATAPKVNLSIHQFSAAPLTYSAAVEVRGKDAGKYLYYSRDRVQSSWKGSGNQEVVSLLVPRPGGSGPAGELKSSKQITGGKSAVGFEAVAPDGATVKYLASAEGGDTLALGGVEIQGEALLLVGNAGLALGASRMTVAGQAVPLANPDFEFKLNAEGAPAMTPIYRPIAPVEIGPRRDVFTDRVPVTLSSKTPGVQIRYTLDGSEPTPQSELYTAPFGVTRTTTVKARAYRPGVAGNPIQLSGTHATVVSTAVYRQQPLSAATSAPDAGAGLEAGYFEGDWKKLLVDFEGLAPVATGTARKLWDTGLIPAGNALVGQGSGARAKPYALEYRGFLDVPNDGVYTLHAPDEYVWPATEAGYDLRVWLGGEQWYPSTRLQGFGTWSTALRKGRHAFRVVFIDYRTDSAAKLNKPGLNPFVWTGTTPDLKISGPGLDAQPVPAAWLRH